MSNPSHWILYFIYCIFQFLKFCFVLFQICSITCNISVSAISSSLSFICLDMVNIVILQSVFNNYSIWICGRSLHFVLFLFFIMRYCLLMFWLSLLYAGYCIWKLFIEIIWEQRCYYNPSEVTFFWFRKNLIYYHSQIILIQLQDSNFSDNAKLSS